MVKLAVLMMGFGATHREGVGGGDKKAPSFWEGWDHILSDIEENLTFYGCTGGVIFDGTV